MAFNSLMHERNIYKNHPNFLQLALEFPEFRQFAVPDANCKKVHVDFTNIDCVRMLSKILLKKDFNLDVEIPQGFLIPTIPQRLNYILWLEDLLIPISEKKKCISGIDIGTGPCAIFPLLGARKNGWNFIASDISDNVIHWAKKNIERNDLKDSIKIVKVSQDTILSEILSSNEDCYEFCMCNPPFFGNTEEINKKHRNSNKTIADIAQEEEIFYEGGEFNFVKNIINDSLIYKDRICVFTSMFGRKKCYLQILKDIRELKDAKVTTTEFCQGNTVRWGIAWTFNESIQFKEEVKKEKPKKPKPALKYEIPIKNYKDCLILQKQVATFLETLQIPLTVLKSSKSFVELILKSEKNTWTHQRRKRRELERQKKKANDFERKFPLSDGVQVEFTASESEGNSKETTSALTKNSVENTTDLKNDITSEYMDICSEKNTLFDHCELDIQTFTVDKQKINIPDILTTTNNSIDKCSESESKNKVAYNPGISQNKRNFINDNLPSNKKIKIDNEVKEDISSEQCTNLSLEIDESDLKCAHAFRDTADHSEMSSNSNGANALHIEDDKIDEASPKHISNHINSTEDGTSKISQDNKQKYVTGEDLSLHKETELDISKKSNIASTEQSLVLDCSLQLRKGKNKIIVVMNCPSIADRNTMYQVFQLIKNKIN